MPQWGESLREVKFTPWDTSAYNNVYIKLTLFQMEFGISCKLASATLHVCCPFCVLALSILSAGNASFPGSTPPPPIVSLHAYHISVPAGTCLRRPGRNPPGWWSRRCRCHLQPPARRSPSPTPTSSRIPQRCSAPWTASCPADFPFKNHARASIILFFAQKYYIIPLRTSYEASQSVGSQRAQSGAFKWQKRGNFHDDACFCMRGDQCHTEAGGGLKAAHRDI